MLDFETLGSTPDTTVITLGAVAFNKDGVIGEELFTFDVNDQIQNYDRKFDYPTLCWWMQQSDDARKQFQPDEMDFGLQDFVEAFEAFCDRNLKKCNEFRDQLKPIGNGANFDISILEHIYKCNLKREIPWKFWNVYDFRTLHNFFKIKDKIKREGVFHNALDDSRYQTECYINFLNNSQLRWKKNDKPKS